MATRIVYRITIDKYGAEILSEFEISTVHKDMATIECYKAEIVILKAGLVMI